MKKHQQKQKILQRDSLQVQEMESNNINQFRQQQYFDILQAAPIIKRAIATTFIQNLKMKNAEMPDSNKLYLMVIARHLLVLQSGFR